MKQTIKQVKNILLIALLFTVNAVWAQEEVGNLFKASPQDASKLVNAYLNPLFKGLGSGLNSGWSHTAKTKGAFRFEIRISAAGALVPENDRTYNTNSLGLTSIQPAVPGNSTGPTAFGNDRAGALMRIDNSPVTFNLPQGLGFHIVPTPQLQLTFGLPKHIDLMARFVPKIKLNNDGGKVGMFGIGAKVEVLPLIMGSLGNKLPFDLAAEMAYSQINFTLPLNVPGGTNQKIDSKFKGFYLDAIISKKIAFFTPFASIGYQTSSTKLAALGNYNFDVPITPATPTGKQMFANPFKIDQNDLNGLRASAGFQMKLGFFKIFGSFTAAQYSIVNGGISFGFGS